MLPSYLLKYLRVYLRLDSTWHNWLDLKSSTIAEFLTGMANFFVELEEQKFRDFESSSIWLLKKLIEYLLLKILIDSILASFIEK